MIRSQFIDNSKERLEDRLERKEFQGRVLRFLKHQRSGSSWRWDENETEVKFQVKLLDILDLQPFNNRFTVRFELLETWLEPTLNVSLDRPILLQLNQSSKAMLIEPTLLVDNSLQFDLNSFNLQKHVPINVPETVSVDLLASQEQQQRVTVSTSGRFVRQSTIKTQIKCLITVQLFPHLHFTCYLRLRSHPLSSGRYKFEQLPILVSSDSQLSDYEVRVFLRSLPVLRSQ
jgi:hypothetical protein